MALKQFIYEHKGCPLPSCEQGQFEIQAGESVKIKLEPKNPDWTLEFKADVTSVTKTTTGRDYVIEYDDVVLGSGGVMFEGCDIVSIDPYCCCDELDERVTALEQAGATVGSVSFTEDNASGVITMTVTDTAGGVVTSTVQDSTLTLDASGNLVDPAGNIVVSAGQLLDTEYVANADGTTTITVGGVPVLTTIVDTDTTYTFNSDGTVTDSNGTSQDVTAKTITDDAIVDIFGNSIPN